MTCWSVVIKTMVSPPRLLKTTSVLLSSAAISFTVLSIITNHRRTEFPEKRVFKYRVRQREDKWISADMRYSVNKFHKKSGFVARNSDQLNHWFKQMENSLKNEQSSIISFLSQPVINDHNFQYLHSLSTACVDSEPDVLIVVPSAPENFHKRNLIRNSFHGAFLKNKDIAAKLVIFLGFTKSTDTQSKIDEESDTFRDIVQESFEDDYRHIRLKAVSMLKWASTFCRQAKYVVRNDDDIIVNLTSAAEAVKRTHLTEANFILGRLRFNDRPRREGKYYLSEEEYPQSTFPPYALGGLLGYPMLTVELLYQAALRVKPIWLDDVYITGICSQKVGVELISDPAFTFEHH